MKKNVRLGLFILFAGCLHTMWSTQVAAQQTDEFSSLDTDQDGFISIKEAVANPDLLASFGKLDLNGDGKLSQVEIAKSLQSPQQDIGENVE